MRLPCWTQALRELTSVPLPPHPLIDHQRHIVELPIAGVE